MGVLAPDTYQNRIPLGIQSVWLLGSVGINGRYAEMICFAVGIMQGLCSENRIYDDLHPLFRPIRIQSSLSGPGRRTPHVEKN